MIKRNSKQIVSGSILSYILIVLNAFYGLVITPAIISTLGTVEYGVYKTIASLSSALMVMDLGLGGTVTRYIAKYKAENNEEEIPNFLAIIAIELLAIEAIILLICGCLYTQIGAVYSATFSSVEIILAKRLFLFFYCNMALTIIENVLHGIIAGCNDFAFGNGVRLIRLIAYIVLISVCLKRYPSSLTLVRLNVSLTIGVVIVYVLWVFRHHGIRVKFKYWNKSLFKESFIYTLLMFTSAIINQVNGNLDNVVIGAVIGASAVTVYSMGLTIFNMFEQLSTAISGVMLPSVTNIIHGKNGMREAQSLVIQAGRIQFCLLGAALVGFAVLGKEFISLWLGSGFEDTYLITLILMVPAIFELSVNVCLSILKAKNLLGFQVGTLFSTTICNAIITVVGTRYFGYFAACIGTAFSWTVGSLIIMNIYYHKKFGFHMLQMYKAIIGKTWLALLIPALIVHIVSRNIGGNWTAFLIKVAIFIILYAILLFLLTPQVRELLKCKKN